MRESGSDTANVCRAFGQKGRGRLPADAEDRGAGAEPGNNDSVTVLVVDDQAVFRGVLRELVAATEGFALVGEAASGEAALEAASELSPRMVVMDKRMPGMGGFEASRVLTDRHPELVVLLISVEEAPDPSVLRSSGAAAYVRKHTLTPAVLRNAWRDYAGCPRHEQQQHETTTTCASSAATSADRLARDERA